MSLAIETTNFSRVWFRDHVHVYTVYNVRTGSKLDGMLQCQSSSQAQFYKFVKQPTCYAPINGMPHLAYLGQMLEKGGGICCQNLPRGVGTYKLVEIVPIHSNCLYFLLHCVKNVFGNPL